MWRRRRFCRVVDFDADDTGVDMWKKAAGEGSGLLPHSKIDPAGKSAGCPRSEDHFDDSKINSVIIS